MIDGGWPTERVSLALREKGVAVATRPAAMDPQLTKLRPNPP